MTKKIVISSANKKTKLNRTTIPIKNKNNNNNKSKSKKTPTLWVKMLNNHHQKIIKTLLERKKKTKKNSSPKVKVKTPEKKVNKLTNKPEETMKKNNDSLSKIKSNNKESNHTIKLNNAIKVLASYYDFIIKQENLPSIDELNLAKESIVKMIETLPLTEEYSTISSLLKILLKTKNKTMKNTTNITKLFQTFVLKLCKTPKNEWNTCSTSNNIEEVLLNLLTQNG